MARVLSRKHSFSIPFSFSRYLLPLSSTSSTTTTSTSTNPSLRSLCLSQSHIPSAYFQTRSPKMSSPTTHKPVDPEPVSEVSKLEDGPTTGSASAEVQPQTDNERNTEKADEGDSKKLDEGASTTKDDSVLAQTSEQSVREEVGSGGAAAQSQADKEENFNQAAEQVGSKMTDAPLTVTKDDAAHLQSRESRALGKDGDISSDSLAADAQTIAAANEQVVAAKGSSESTKEEQSAVDKELEHQQAIEAIKPKMDHEPGNVTKEDAALLHSTEYRAHGKVEKGGIAAQAQSLAAENEKENEKQASGDSS